MNPPLQSFVTVALPIMITILPAMWTSNRGTAELSARVSDLRSDINRCFEDLIGDMGRRFGEMNRRFDEVITRLDRIEEAG